VSWEGVTVQVLLPDGRGDLRPIASVGEPVMSGRLRSARRRQVFETGRPTRVALRSPAGCSLDLLPLVADGSVIGVLEIVARTARLDDRREIIDAVVGQAALVFRTVREKTESDSALVAMGGELRLAAELLRAGSPASAVKSAVRLCFERLCVPVAGLLPDRAGTGWFIVAAHGLGPSRRVELRRSLDEVSVLTQGDDLRRRLAGRFAAAVDRKEAHAVEAGDAVLLVADASFAQGEFLRSVASLLGEALDRIGTVGWAQVRNEHLDLAIALTAHELRGPLAGARAALDRVNVPAADPRGRALLRRTRDELRQMSDLVDPLLRWSAGSGSLQMRRTDLMRIVRDAVESCSLEFPDRSVTVEGPVGVPIRADAQELRGAIANVVRNALGYSPPTTPVTVCVETDADVARVLVRDRGPGIPAAERHLIFDPFARGGAAGGGRGGKGLGLFIARRVVEAHGGVIGLRPVRPGAEFCIELPFADGRSAPSAS
jgi:signal transduction histidine kinase